MNDIAQLRGSIRLSVVVPTLITLGPTLGYTKMQVFRFCPYLVGLCLLFGRSQSIKCFGRRPRATRGSNGPETNPAIPREPTLQYVQLLKYHLDPSF